MLLLLDDGYNSLINKMDSSYQELRFQVSIFFTQDRHHLRMLHITNYSYC